MHENSTLWSLRVINQKFDRLTVVYIPEIPNYSMHSNGTRSYLPGITSFWLDLKYCAFYCERPFNKIQLHMDLSPTI